MNIERLPIGMNRHYKERRCRIRNPIMTYMNKGVKDKIRIPVR